MAEHRCPFRRPTPVALREPVRLETVRAIRYMRQRAIELNQDAGYSGIMTTKQKVIKAVQALPDDASFEDAMERLLFLAKVEKGIQQADAGQTIPHEKVKKMMKKWLK